MHIAEERLAAVRINTLAGIRSAAESLRDATADIADLRVAATHNIASSTPMSDADGGVLAREVFGFGDEHSSWWQFPQLALTSPLPMACRFESEPFCCNAGGIRTQSPNLLLARLDLSNFRKRALTSAAIVAPVHLPFGQIGAVSFLSRDPGVDDLAERV